MDERVLHDELLLGLSRANPAPLEAFRGAVDSVAAGAVLEEILRAPRVRTRRRAVVAELRRARQLDGLDPFEMLGTANPAPVSAVAAFSTPEESARRASLLDSIIDSTPVPGAAWNRRRIFANLLVGLRHAADSLGPRRPVDGAFPRPTLRRSRRTVVIPLLGVSILVAAAAGFVVARLHSTKLLTACYSSASVSHSDLVKNRSANSVGLYEPDDVAGCQALWLKGAFGAPRKPHLVACILPSGSVGVFPGKSGQLCTKLNLSIALAPSERTKAIGKLNDTLEHELRLSQCVDATAARAIVEHELGRFGLAGWSITMPVKPTAARHCTTALVVLPDTVQLDANYFIPIHSGPVTTTSTPPLRRS